jgi:ankyrin repeat protein
MGINLNFENKQGLRPINYLILNGDINLLKLFIDHSIDLNFTIHKLCNFTTIQYAFKYCPNKDMIKYIIDLGINIDSDIDPKITCEQLIYKNDYLTKKEKQQLVLYYLTKLLNKPDIVDNFIDSINQDNKEFNLEKSEIIFKQ